MKKLITMGLCLSMGATLLSGCGNSNSDTSGSGSSSNKGNGQVITLQPASWQENGFWAEHIELFADYVNEHSEGRVVVNPTSPGSVVSTDQAMQAVSDGLTPAMAVASAYVAGTIDLGYVFCTPPVVQNISDMRDLYENYEGGRICQLWENAVEQKYNVHVVGEMYGPADVPIVSNVPINGVNDLKSVTIRVGAGSIADSLVKLGASTDFSATTEVYTMLSTKAIDAAIMGSPSDDLASSYNEVTKYWVQYPYVNTSHCTTFVINNDVWNSMSEEDQQICVDAIDHSNSVIEEEGYQVIQEAWDTVEGQGIEIIRWTDEDAQTWAQTFYDTCAEYSEDATYQEYMDLLYKWSVEKGYLSE